MTPFDRRILVHLAYLDDSDTKQKPTKIQVMSGIIIEDTSFKVFDIAMRFIRNELVPEEKLDKFSEFHAAELFGGYGVFEGIEREKRLGAIRKLLKLLSSPGSSVVYGAVDIAKTKREVFGSADPLDMAFRICLSEISEWVKNRAFSDSGDKKDEDEELRRWLAALVLLIVDDCSQKDQRAMLQDSFRNLRHPSPAASKTMSATQRFAHFHDDVFFGDSRYSVGIQLADLCSYFIARHLQGDEEIQEFYDLIEPHISYGQFYPEQKEFKRPQPRLSSLRLALAGLQDEKRISKVRSDDGGTVESSPRADQEETRGGEAEEAGEAETESA
jgi:uncharacterized protein DUF3800